MTTFETDLLKPFDLQRCIAGDPVVTRDGRTYKFGACDDGAQSHCQLIGWVGKDLIAHYKNGVIHQSHKSKFDLFMVPKTKKIWIVTFFLCGASWCVEFDTPTDAAAAIQRQEIGTQYFMNGFEVPV